MGVSDDRTSLITSIVTAAGALATLLWAQRKRLAALASLAWGPVRRAMKSASDLRVQKAIRARDAAWRVEVAREMAERDASWADRFRARDDEWMRRFEEQETRWRESFKVVGGSMLAQHDLVAAGHAANCGACLGTLVQLRPRPLPPREGPPSLPSVMAILSPPPEGE